MSGKFSSPSPLSLPLDSWRRSLTCYSAKFNITAREGRGDEYCGMFAEAAERVKSLIELA